MRLGVSPIDFFLWLTNVLQAISIVNFSKKLRYKTTNPSSSFFSSRLLIGFGVREPINGDLHYVALGKPHRFQKPVRFNEFQLE